MKDFEIHQTKGDFEVTHTWKWMQVKSAEIKTFQWGDEPEVIHIIKTGFDDLYLVVWEDAFQESLGKTEILRNKDIKDKFNIEL